MVRPGLGKTGLKRMGVGRYELLSVGNLGQFFRQSRDIKPELVCRFSSEELTDDSAITAYENAREILSLDGSEIYNSLFSIAGGHGDVRGFDTASCKLPGRKELQKRQHTMYLVLNFTKSNYRNWLITHESH